MTYSNSPKSKKQTTFVVIPSLRRKLTDDEWFLIKSFLKLTSINKTIPTKTIYRKRRSIVRFLRDKKKLEFHEIGSLLKFSKQRAHQLYWQSKGVKSYGR